MKLDYLSRYIDVFETSMRDKWGYRNYIDLFAGPGKNQVEETGEIFLGSPLVALTVKYPFTGYHFVEFEVEMAEALETRCSASNVFKKVHIKIGDCNQVVDTIVDELQPNEQQSLNLAFLDPAGLELQWSTIASLASINRIDLIINYPQGGLNRAMPKVVDEDAETSVDRFFGSREWRHIYSEWQINRKSGKHRQLIDLYMGRLKDLGYVEVLRDDEVGDEPLISNLKRRAPMYRLLFASKHPLGEKFWHSITSRDVYGQRRLFDM